jgi:hypothetical protein
VEKGSTHLQSYFDLLYEIFLVAVQNVGTVDRCYSIAGCPFLVQFAGEDLWPHITPALEHLLVEQTSTPCCTICVWDGVMTNTDVIPVPPSECHIVSSDNTDAGKISNPTIYFTGDGIRGVFRPATHTLSIFNVENNTGLFWAPDARQIRYDESSTPMRAIFQWWAKENSLQLVHAGAVGRSTEGLLLVGTSGSGKSCTALSCLDAGYTCGGDDHMLLQIEPTPYAHSLYNVCRLKVSDTVRFPYLQPAILPPSRTGTDKALVFLYDYFPAKTSRGFHIRAIVIPFVTNNARTRLEGVSPAVAFKALAPSTVLQLPGAGKSDLQWMAKLVQQVPGYRLELGKDIDNVPYVLLNLLSQE